MKYLRAASPRANQKSEAPIIIVLSTSKNAAAVRSGATAGGPSTSAAAAEAAPGDVRPGLLVRRRSRHVRTGGRAAALAARRPPSPID